MSSILGAYWKLVINDCYCGYFKSGDVIIEYTLV